MKLVTNPYFAAIKTKEGLASVLTLTFILLSLFWQLAGLQPTYIIDYLAITGAFIGGIIIAQGALKGLLAKEMNVDELVMIAIVASFFTHEYFSAGLVSFMMLFGKVLEDLTAGRAEAAIKELGTLLPNTARVLIDGKEVSTSIKDLKKGETVVVRPGELIPVDGKITSGEASVDQAVLTGESVPIYMIVGNDVLAGSLVNEGSLEIEVEAVGSETTLGSVSKLAEDALEDRAPVVKSADRYARFVTPGVLVIAGLTYYFTHNITNAVSVLVAACPCVLVLATPTALVASVAAGAKRGLLIRGGSRLEAGAKINTIAFDKTGTLTIGQPSVQQIIPQSGFSKDEILKIAASAEHLSEHPLAKAIVERAKKEEISLEKPTNFKSYPGLGVSISLDKKEVVVGTPRLFEKLEISLSKETSEMISSVEEKGETTVVISVDKKIAGIITLSDTLHSDAKSTIALLHKSGINHTVMLTGDNEAVAMSIAKKVGIKEVFAKLLPAQKVEQIQKLQQQGLKVAMIGDGVNDAASLSIADLSITMGKRAADVTLQSADIVILSDKFSKAAEAILLSKATFRIIKQNLIIAGVWNILAIAASATGILNPVTAALVHNAGSVFVVVNAARLTQWKALS